MQVEKSIQSLPFHASRNCRGFTIVEFMTASFIGFLAMGLVWTALMGFQFQTRTTVAQTLSRHNSQNAMEKIGRIVMESTKLNIETSEAGMGMLRVWRDEQIVWTPNHTEDDTEGLLYYLPEEKELWFRPNVDQPDTIEKVADRLDGVEFSLVGDAVFVTLHTEYDVDPNHRVGSEETMRKTYGSFAVRNNPRIRIGATF